MDERPTHLDLFSGIGGFALAAELAGFRTIAFCEKDPRCRNFLAKAWPGREIHDDIRTLDARRYRGISLLTGGPPCQPASRAGEQRGQKDDRWLWDEALRVLEEAEPDSVLFENPPGILDVGIDGILAAMEACGYEVQPFDIPACAVGSPQLRHRIWIVGFRDLAHPAGTRQNGTTGKEQHLQRQPLLPARPCDSSGHMAHTEPERWERGRNGPQQAEGRWPQCPITGLPDWDKYIWLPCADGKVRRTPDDSIQLVDGLHRSLLGAVGNSIVPQVAYQIIKAIYQQLRP